MWFKAKATGARRLRTARPPRRAPPRRRAPTAPRSGRKSTPARDVTSRSTPSTPRWTASRARDSSDRGSASRRRSGAGAGASSTACARLASAALRQAYHAFTAMADGLQSRLETEMSARPPRLAAALLAWRLPREWREFVLGDLEEEFAARAAAGPAAAARSWFWWQALRVPRGAAARPPPRDGPPPPLRRFQDAHARRRSSPCPPRDAAGAGVTRSRSSPSSRSGSAPTPRSSASSTRCCCGRCRFDEPERLVRIFHSAAAGRLPRPGDLRAVAGQLLRLAARRAVVRGDGDVSVPPVHADGHGQGAIGQRRHRRRGVLRDRAGTAAARPIVPAGRATPRARRASRS